MNLFNLKTSVAELTSSNGGTSRMKYDQHPPTRDVTNATFHNGPIHFRWQTSGQTWWVPSHSYIKMKVKYTKGNGAPLDLGDDVAPVMGTAACLFQSGDMQMADKTVSRVADFMAQVDAVSVRSGKSQGWIDSIGSSTNNWQPDFLERKSSVSNNGLLVKNSVQSHVTDAYQERTRVRLDLDSVVGGAANDRNALSFDAGTNTFTLAQNGGAALPAATSVLFPVDSYIKYTAIFGVADADDIRYNNPVRVIGHPSATTVLVENNNGLTNVDVDGRTEFNSLRPTLAGPPGGNINVARRVGETELVWRPPFSLMKVDHALPGGRYEMTLNPQTKNAYKKRAIESALADLEPGAAGQFDFEVVDMYLYVATVDGPRSDNKTYLLDLDEINCQADVANSASFSQRNMDVSPSTYALTVAFQDDRAGANTLYSASKFKINGALSDELKLNRMFIQYAGQSRPSPDANPEFDAAKDNTVQRYIESQIHNGAFWSPGGAEDISQYHERGSYYHFKWPRDANDRSTRVNVHFGFNAAPANGRILLFDHHRKVARVQVRDGMIVDVQVEDQ